MMWKGRPPTLSLSWTRPQTRTWSSARHGRNATHTHQAMLDHHPRTRTTTYYLATD